MRALIALIIAVAIGLCVYYLYVRQVQNTGGGENPTQAITATGVKNDLLAIAQAERVYYSEHGAYASLDQLIDSGALTAPRRERDGYTYSVDVAAAGFTVTARHSGQGFPAFVIDQTMQIRSVP